MKIIITKNDRGTYSGCALAPVPTGTNAAGLPWSEVFKCCGKAGKEPTLPIELLTDDEAQQIRNGALIEIPLTIPGNISGDPLSTKARTDAVKETVSKTVKTLFRELEQFGRTIEL